MFATLGEWLANPAISGNATVLLVAGIIYANEENLVEALKACHLGLTLEMWASHICISAAYLSGSTLLLDCRMALSVQVYLRMDRVDQAEKQLKVQIDTILCSNACRGDSNFNEECRPCQP